MDDILWNDIGTALVLLLLMIALIAFTLSLMPRSMTAEEFRLWLDTCGNNCSVI